ncbi:hypothetical protein [Mycoplasmopsis cynos]|uniref:hypothetical protein n=1 Tax=Mycoplasmopsis cynos TaxID=171284 RepID=UPI0024C5CD6B|nr:hypothetical protein [Mycoplasmopsis cynos]WAM07322.1 hypothetical protein ONA21_03850 [Mycoplasmopsis cynos]
MILSFGFDCAGGVTEESLLESILFCESLGIDDFGVFCFSWLIVLMLNSTLTYAAFKYVFKYFSVAFLIFASLLTGIFEYVLVNSFALSRISFLNSSSFLELFLLSSSIKPTSFLISSSLEFSWSPLNFE